MNVLVVGANSFIASDLISELKKDSEVTGIYNKNKDRLHADIRNVNIADLHQLNNNFDIVYLVGAYIPENAQSGLFRQQMFDSNVALTEMVCNKFKDSRIIFISSVSVYKQSEKEICESSTVEGLNEYGISKLWGEKVILNARNYSIIRLSSVYGRGMKLNTIIPTYVCQALEKGVITVWGDGKRKQNYIHISDVVNYLKSVARINKNGIFLGTSPESISNLQLAEIISKITGCDISFTNTDLSPSFSYNNSDTLHKLKISRFLSIERGIEELIVWLKKY